jgi:hypothetical protein
METTNFVWETDEELAAAEANTTQTAKNKHGYTADQVKQFKDDWGYDANEPDEVETAYEHPQTPVSHKRTKGYTVLPDGTVKRRASPIRFTDTQIRMILSAHAAGRTVREITVYLRSQPDGAKITGGAVRRRIKQGYPKRAPESTITAEEMETYINEHARL